MPIGLYPAGCIEAHGLLSRPFAARVSARGSMVQSEPLFWCAISRRLTQVGASAAHRAHTRRPQAFSSWNSIRMGSFRCDAGR